MYSDDFKKDLKHIIKKNEKLLWLSPPQSRATTIKDLSTSKSFISNLISKLNIRLLRLNTSTTDYDIYFALTNKRALNIIKPKNMPDNGSGKPRSMCVEFTYSEMKTPYIIELKGKAMFTFGESTLKQKFLVVPTNDVNLVKNILASKGKITSVVQNPSRTLN